MTGNPDDTAAQTHQAILDAARVYCSDVGKF
jgi:hypothetical protein